MLRLRRRPSEPLVVASLSGVNTRPPAKPAPVVEEPAPVDLEEPVESAEREQLRIIREQLAAFRGPVGEALEREARAAWEAGRPPQSRGIDRSRLVY